jgi:hypothetical protein
VATTFEIHPAVGIARVGTSAESFVGPEPGTAPPAGYRDKAGNLLRQAARFRVFRCTRATDGTLRSATEVTPEQAHVGWTVHVVNAKAAAEEFPPVASRRSAAAGAPRLRNARHTDRAALVIDPGPRTVGAPGQRAVFDSGTFLGAAVPLGDIRCDPDGALVVAGGFGTSGFVSPDGSRVPIGNFANNDNWFDDTSDGIVTATVAVGTRPPVEAKPARVIVAPPDFAPGIVNLITLYDVAFQAAVERGWRRVPDKPSFARDVQPILQRALGYQWVLQLARQGHGPGMGMGDFASLWLALGDPSAAHVGARQGVFATLRDPAGRVTDDDFGFMPRLHHSDYATFPNAVLRLTPSQYAVLQRWADGHFVKDLDRPKAVRELVPDALDRVALQACSGGPFFPGIEVGRVMADPQTYSEAFRVDAASLPPGRLTAGNAVPWQADFLACSVDAQPQLAWWPAQRPYQVLTSLKSEVTRFWDRGVTGYAGMVDEWHRLGIVVEQQRADGTPVFVESERKLRPA